MAQTSIPLRAYWKLFLFVLMGFLNLDLRCSESSIGFQSIEANEARN